MSEHRALLTIAALAAAIAAVGAIKPFRASGVTLPLSRTPRPFTQISQTVSNNSAPIATLLTPRGNTSTAPCGPPIIDAWHSETPSGWFGYAPLTSTPLASTPVTTVIFCRSAAQHRLGLAFSRFFAALVLVGFAELLRRQGLGPTTETA